MRLPTPAGLGKFCRTLCRTVAVNAPVSLLNSALALLNLHE